MMHLATLQRVIHELKRKKGYTTKEISKKTGLQYVYLSKQISGSVKLTDSIYRSIMEFARKEGIDTSVIATNTLNVEPTINADVAQAGLSGVINVSIRIENNKITGVDWQILN